MRQFLLPRMIRAKEVVAETGRLILERYIDRDFDKAFKDDGSPVTSIDKEVELILREKILERFPEDSFVGEEFEDYVGKNKFTWYCDPIDGTWCFINGEKTFATSLALNYEDETVLAIVNNPVTYELYTGANGIKTALNDVQIPLRNPNNPKDSVINFQISRTRSDMTSILYKLWEDKKIGKLVSTQGSVAYNLALVAQGTHSAYIVASSRAPNEWDIAGGRYLVESVGGYMEKFDKNILVASSSLETHEKTLKMLYDSGFLN